MLYFTMDLVAPNAPSSDTKSCPFCGEEIKKVAIRCKHCQADLSKADADFNRGAAVEKTADAALVATGPVSAGNADDFEQRMLEFAYRTTATINVPSVPHALTLPTAQVNDRLEDIAPPPVPIPHIHTPPTRLFTPPPKP